MADIDIIINAAPIDVEVSAAQGVSSAADNTVAASAKATPVDADLIPLVDSAASNVLKKLTWANLKATAKTYFDTLYATAAQGTAANEAKTKTDHLTVTQAVDLDAMGTASHAAVTITGNGLTLTGQQISLSFGTSSTQVAVGNHTHSGANIVSGDIARARIDDALSANAAPIVATSFDSNAAFSVGYRAITSGRTLDATDHVVECTANSFTVTLPTAVGIARRIYHIKNSGNGSIAIATTSSQTIDGLPSLAISLPQYTNLSVQSNGANWIIL